MRQVKRFSTSYQFLEFGSSSLYFAPLPSTTFGITLLRHFLNAEEIFLAEGKIDIGAITSFEKDKGFPIFKPPYIAITFFDPCSIAKPQAKKHQYFFFSQYYFRPSREFYKLIEEFRSRGIREL